MHERTNIQLSAIDRNALEAVVANRNSAQKYVWRAKIVLMTADGHMELPKSCAPPARQDGDLALAGTVPGRGRGGRLWRDKTRPSRIPPLSLQCPNGLSP